MRVLMVTKFIPYPANTGGKLRSIAILRRYLERGDRVTLVAHDDGTADVPALEKLGVHVVSAVWRGGPKRLVRGILKGKSAILGRFYTPELYRRARQLAQAEPFDVLQVEYLHNCVYRDVIDGTRNRTVTVLDLHDVASEQARKISRLKRLPLRAAYYGEALALGRRERLVLREYDVLACVSEHDAQQLGPGRFVVAPNGWTPSEPLAPPEGDNVVFVGNFAFAINVDAALWLAEKIWPRVRARIPAAQLYIVGKDPVSEVLALHGRDGITVTGTVPEVSPYLRRSRVAIAPLRAGSGSRLKILEALEAARPVVSTTVGLEGLETFAKSGVILADEPEAFADRVCELLRDHDRAAALGAAGREAVHQTFLWDRTLSPMFDALDRALATRKQGAA
ncbi:MAG: glycosyl transferase group 1 [Myxococcaceae bacterium]|nr:glycosyl transferase group 1 [Myxococcaceae bacterium]